MKKLFYILLLVPSILFAQEKKEWKPFQDFDKKFKKTSMPILCEHEIKKIFFIPRLSIFLSRFKLSSLLIITNIYIL